MKTLNLSLLASCISLALLSGCNSGSDTAAKIDHIKDSITDTTNDIKDSIDNKKTKTITVIDGYLENADVYIDRNGNKIADADEKLDKKTDSKGQISISVADVKFDLIAQVNGAATKDSDGQGTTGRSYQMFAEAGLDYITPFTTIAQVEGKTLAEVAAELEISEAVISGDYVAQKKNTEAETANDAKKAHAYARNLTTTLSEDLSKNKTETVTRVINEIKTEIDKADNNNADLDKLNMSDTVKLQDLFVAGATFHSLPLNTEFFNQENITTLNIIDDSSFNFTNEKGTDKGTFKFAEDDANAVTFTMEDGETEDHPISITKNSYISIDENDGIMDVYSKTMEQQPITAATFTDTQWYQLFDDSDYHKEYNKPQPCIMKVNFKADGTMKYSEMGDCRVEDGELHEYPYQWKVEKNQLVIFDNDTTNDHEGGEALRNILSSNEQMMVTVNVMKNADTKTALYIKDKKQAIALFNAWKKAIKH